MRLIKKINNNFALAVDDNGEEVIVHGKGVGFQKMPRILDSLSEVDRTYYNVDPKYYGLVGEISPDTMETAVAIVDECKKKLRVKLNPNLLFTMADHIDFAIKRYQRKMSFSYPMIYDLEQAYETEMEIAGDALKLIQKRQNVKLPKSEKAGIAMNIINAEMIPKTGDIREKEADIISNITGIIQNYFSIKIDRTDANYARYASHMHYLLERLAKKESLSTENVALIRNAKEQFPEEYQCAVKIASYLEMKYETEVSEEEKLYLMLHINRLCVREGL